MNSPASNALKSCCGFNFSEDVCSDFFIRLQEKEGHAITIVLLLLNNIQFAKVAERFARVVASH